MLSCKIPEGQRKKIVKSLFEIIILYSTSTHLSSINCFTVCRSCRFHCNIFPMRHKNIIRLSSSFLKATKYSN